MTSKRLSSPMQTTTSLKSGVMAMPRGRRPVGIVLTTFSVSLSRTVTVLSRSFETKTRPAYAAVAVNDSARTAAGRIIRFT